MCCRFVFQLKKTRAALLCPSCQPLPRFLHIPKTSTEPYLHLMVSSHNSQALHVPVRDFNYDIFCFVFLVFTSCDTGRQVSRVLLSDSAQLTNVVVSGHQSAVRQLCSSGHNLEV